MKKILCFIAAIAVLITLCTVYTRCRMAVYGDIEQCSVGVRYPSGYAPIANDCTDDCFWVRLKGRTMTMDAYYIWLQGILDSPDNNIKDGRSGHSNNKLYPYAKMCSVELTDLEYCILMDYLNYVLRPIYENAQEYDRYGEKYEGRHKVPYYVIFFYCYDEGREWDDNFYLVGNRPAFLVFAWLMPLPLYIRHTYPILLAIWLLYFAAVHLLIEKKTKGMGFADKTRLMTKYAERPIAFLVYGCGSVMLVGLLICSPAAAIVFDRIIYYRFMVNTVNPEGAYLGINYLGGALLWALQLFVLKKTAQGRSYIYAYLIPTAILAYLQWLLFYKLLGTSEYYYSIPTLMVRSFIGINEGAFFHKHITVFTLFFAIDMLLYFIFGFIANRDIRKNFAWSTAFAAVNALMCCSCVYVVNFGHQILYDVSYFT